MKPNHRFLSQPQSFWANVRAISETIGYSKRGEGIIFVPTFEDMKKAMLDRNLQVSHLFSSNSEPTELCKLLREYFKYRANRLNNFVEPRLMDVNKARALFKKMRRKLKPLCPLPLNKQKGEKKSEAYLTCIVNMIVEANAKGLPCDYDPRQLTIFTAGGKPVRTLSRRIDGAFTSVVNPIAIWEVKEYYYTTTFGSRVADGIYETLLDGMEIAELREHEQIDVLHYLIIDSHYTWWECGRPYLCRIFDALHMGYIDEVLFGYEVIERLPYIVKQWVKIAR
jgi:hypothetical protein